MKMFFLRMSLGFVFTYPWERFFFKSDIAVIELMIF